MNHQGGCSHGRLDDTALPDDQRVRGRDLTAKLRVQHHGAGARVAALDLRALVQEGAETTPLALRFALSIPPHDPPQQKTNLRFAPRREVQGRYQRLAMLPAAGSSSYIQGPEDSGRVRGARGRPRRDGR